MITEIKTIGDVKAFAKHLVEVEKISFHPDEDFNDYVNLATEKPSYTAEEAAIRNKLMSDCFEVCNKNKKDVYDVMGSIATKEFRRAYGVK